MAYPDYHLEATDENAVSGESDLTSEVDHGNAAGFAGLGSAGENSGSYTAEGGTDANTRDPSIATVTGGVFVTDAADRDPETGYNPDPKNR